MNEDIGTFHQLVTGMTTVATVFFAFIGRRFIGKVDETAEALTKHEKDDIGKYATVDQLTRVHTRIDESVRSSEDNFRELRNAAGEIKTLLIQGAQK